MKRNMNEWLQGILNSEEKFGLPITSYPCLPLTGRTMQEVLNDAQANYELIHANVKRFPIPVAQSVIDLTMEAEAFGAKVGYTKTGLPTIVEEPVSDKESIMNLQVPELGDARTHVFLKAAELAVKNIEDVPFMPIPILDRFLWRLALSVLTKCLSWYSQKGRCKRSCIYPFVMHKWSSGFVGRNL